MSYTIVTPVVDASVRSLCTRRYSGHPRGCPNHGRRPSCPPAALMIGNVLDLSQPVHAVWNAFDLGAHVERMRARHPAWSKRQLACCLYWQGTARKQLRVAVRECVLSLGVSGARSRVVTCPEACGVNVTATMKSVGIKLEWPPARTAHQVALVGYSYKGLRRVLRDTHTSSVP